MRRLLILLAMMLGGANLCRADDPTPLLFNNSVVDIRPAADPPEIERVVPFDGDDLVDAESDMPEDEDLEYLTYCCQPQWRFSAAWLYLTRESPNNGALLLNDADDSTLLDANQLDFGYQSGFDLAAIFNKNACCGFELRYLWIDDWAAAARVANPGAVNIATAPNTGPLLNTTFDTAYFTRLQSVEANLRHSLGESQLLIGFRYTLLDEELLTRGFDGGATTQAHFTTQNDLFGMQLGIAHDWCSPYSPLGLGGFVKVGAYYNAADADAVLVVGAAPVNAARDVSDTFAFLGEMGIEATYCVRANLLLRVGYRLLLIDGVALATEQVDRTTALQIINPTLAAHDDGTLFAHGLSAGVEFAW
jgi:hypothetical protein